MNQKQVIAGAHQGRPLPRVRSGSTSVLRGAALVLVLTGVGLPVTFAVGGESTSASAPFLVVGGITALVVLMGAALARRGAKKAIARMLTDEQTVHWTYRPTEWQRFVSYAWPRRLLKALILTGFILFLILDNRAMHTAGAEMVAGTVLIVGVGLLYGIWATVLWQWRQRLTTGEVYINRTGVILGGWYYSLGSLIRVTYEAGVPGLLRFKVGSWLVRGGWTIETPVPQGREVEAQRLAQDL